MAKSTNTATPRKARSRSLRSPAHSSAASTPRPLALRPAPQSPAGANGVAAIRPGSVADRTRNQLLDAASALIGEIGHVPSVGEVARAAGVSRATAYRYFSSRSRLIAAVVDSSLGPVRRFESQLKDVDSRVVELFGTTFVRFREFEPQMRSALQLSLEHAALEAAGRLDEDRYRRGYRIDILRRTFAPLRQSMPARSVDRLCKAMSLLFGIEPYVVLKDIWDCDNEEVCRIALWMARALLRQAQLEAAGLSASPR